MRIRLVHLCLSGYKIIAVKARLQLNPTHRPSSRSEGLKSHPKTTFRPYLLTNVKTQATQCDLKKAGASRRPLSISSLNKFKVLLVYVI